MAAPPSSSAATDGQAKAQCHLVFGRTLTKT
jgi:hypothetical protein